jgi:hypothetical protein
MRYFADKLSMKSNLKNRVKVWRSLRRKKAAFYISAIFFVSLFYTNCSKPFQVRSDAGILDLGSNGSNPLILSTELTYVCGNAEARGLSFDHMRRLSSSEIKNTLRDLLGSKINGDDIIQTKLAGISEDRTLVAGDFVATPSSNLPQVLFDVAARAANLLIASSDLRKTVLASCAEAAVPDSACLRSIAQDFGFRVFRRPVSDAEVSKFLASTEVAKGGMVGLAGLVRQLLQSPTLVFHIEEGQGVAINGRVRLTDYEVASRISYLSINTMPDAALFAAAKAGQLKTVNNIAVHVTRLLKGTDASAKVKDFFRYYLQMAAVPKPFAPAATEDQISAAGLETEMYAELKDYVDYVFWADKSKFSDLMSSTVAFPRSDRMAKILSTAVAAANIPSVSPTHRGLLLRPAMLAGAASRTSPIPRGAHIRKLILCEDLGMPPAAAVSARQTELGDIENMSNRQKTVLLTNSPTCMGCHSRINELGFAFEGYDQLGFPRTFEKYFDSSGRVTKQFPVDSRITQPNIESFTPNALNDAQGLVQQLGNSPKARACFTKKLFEYYRLQQTNSQVDGCALRDVEIALQTQDLKTALSKTLANEDLFWRKATPEGL